VTDTWTYVLVTPDGVVSGALDRIVDVLRGDGFDVVAGRAHALRIADMLRVYASPGAPTSGGGGESTRLFQLLYDSGPACLLLLHRRSGGAALAATRCKGATRPEAAAPGTFRHWGENVVLNLAHSPDDEAGARRELAILVGAAEAERLRAVASAPPGELDDLIGWRTLRASLPAVSGWEAISFPVAAHRIRLRVCQWLALRTSVDALRAAHRLLGAERDALSASSTGSERMRVAQEANAGVHQQLASAARGHAVSDGLEALAALYEVDGERRPDAVLGLAEHGIYLSPLEKMVLETHTATFRPR
jgi:nucleoside diphosphate kinase